MTLDSFDRFNEGNTSSEIESLRKIRCVLELSGMFNSEVEEQLHLKMMTPINHIYLFRSICKQFSLWKVNFRIRS